tara:strand:+ start:56 stop:406 length:351 start_codon:yes stop_codon:yes gene_type:complete
VPEVLSGWRVHKDSESWKKPNKFNEEKIEFIKKIEKNETALIQNHKTLWTNFKIQTLKKNAINLIIQKNSYKARLEIKNNFIFNFQIIIIYLSSFFSFSGTLFRFILNKRKKVKPV